MDLATPLGIVIAFVAVVASFVMEGGSPTAFLSPPAMILVFGGSLAVSLASNRLGDTGSIVKALMRALMPTKTPAETSVVTEIMSYADTARQEGLLALEEKVKGIEDPFLRRGLELVIDGTDSDEVAEALGSEVDALRERHKVAAKFFADMGAFAPTLGIIGTVLGLVHALEGLSDPAKLGQAISAAFIATLWGVISANLMWLPLANKLKRISSVEVAYRHLVIQGVLALQAGQSSRAVRERLKSHLAPRQRTALDGEQEKQPEKLSA